MAQRGVKTLYIEPGSPWQNGHVESLNQPIPMLLSKLNPNLTLVVDQFRGLDHHAPGRAASARHTQHDPWRPATWADDALPPHSQLADVMKIETIQALKRQAIKAGIPIAYVSEPTPTTVRIVFEDGWVSLSEAAAQDRINARRDLRLDKDGV